MAEESEISPKIPRTEADIFAAYMAKDGAGKGEVPAEQAATEEQAVAELQEADDDASGNGGSFATDKEHQQEYSTKDPARGKIKQTKQKGA